MHNQNPEILADRAAGCPRQKRRTWLVAGVVTTLSLTVVAATAVAPATTTVPRDTVIEALGAPVYRVLSAEPQPFVQEDRVRRGDTLQGTCMASREDEDTLVCAPEGGPGGGNQSERTGQ